MKTNVFNSVPQKVLLMTTTVFMLIVGSTKAQQNSKTTAKMTMYEVKQDYTEQFRKVLNAYVLKAISSKNNIMAEAYFEQDKPTILWLIERWNTKNELQDFNKTAEAKTLESLMKNALEKPAKAFYVKDLEPLTKQQWRTTSKKEDNQLVIVLFVDSKEGTQQNFKDTYHVAMPQFRSEPGVVTYQLSEVEENETQFVTYEKFRSQDAFQYHLNFPPIKPVIQYLETNIKSQPFQQGLHTLVEFSPMTRE